MSNNDQREINFVLLDYSEEYYRDAARTVAPDKISGKFVQMRNKQTEYLILSPKELAPYHANLVERFCRDRGLKGDYTGEGKRYDIREPAWTIVGGGKFDIDRSARQIRLYDNSMAYGRFDSKFLAEKIRSVDKMADYQVMIY